MGILNILKDEFKMESFEKVALSAKFKNLPEF